MSTENQAPNRDPPGGRQRVFEAALRLAEKGRSLHAVGVRAIGREAGLNPNTFYRHFGSIDELALEMIDWIGRDLRSSLRQLRREAEPPREITVQLVADVFDFAMRRPEVITVAARELHGASPVIRKALRRLIRNIAADMAEDMRALGMAPEVDDATLQELYATIVRHVFYLCLDVLEQPRKRNQYVRQASSFINMLLAGAEIEANRQPAVVKSPRRSKVRGRA